MEIGARGAGYFPPGWHSTTSDASRSVSSTGGAFDQALAQAAETGGALDQAVEAPKETPPQPVMSQKEVELNLSRILMESLFGGHERQFSPNELVEDPDAMDASAVPEPSSEGSDSVPV